MDRSERDFSDGGNIITKRRCNLGDENTRFLLCLRDWGVLLEEDNDEIDDFDEEPQTIFIE